MMTERSTTMSIFVLQNTRIEHRTFNTKEPPIKEFPLHSKLPTHLFSMFTKEKEAQYINNLYPLYKFFCYL